MGMTPVRAGDWRLTGSRRSSGRECALDECGYIVLGLVEGEHDRVQVVWLELDASGRMVARHAKFSLRLTELDDVFVEGCGDEL